MGKHGAGFDLKFTLEYCTGGEQANFPETVYRNWYNEEINSLASRTIPVLIEMSYRFDGGIKINMLNFN